ncbi:MAG: hypothetical protein EOP49_12030 [Sphingobacteriales bacterium]|nr:MAG: hypothetical protein EOP49_12030 [Sphingobacteriales bacterium]
MADAYRKILAVLCLFFFLTGCKEEDCDCGPVPGTEGKKRVLIVSEGSLGNGNGQLDLYLSEKDSLYLDVSGKQNNQPLGDVFQSLSFIDGRYFLAINNSDRIIVLNKEFQLLSQIPVTKPRYILPVGGERAYVSGLFTNKLQIINTSSLALTGTIELPRNNPEGLLTWGEHVFLATWDTASNRIYKISTASNKLVDSFLISGYAPQEILLDKEGKLWVLAGNVVKGKVASLTRLDPADGQTLATYQFPAAADPMRPVFNRTRDTLHFIEVNYTGGTQHNGIFRMPIHDLQLPSIPFIAAGQFQYFWGLGINPWNGDIYVGDPKGFIQKGSVHIYSPEGILIKELKTGVGPGHFYFAE